MTSSFYPLTRSSWGQEEKAAIDRVISSGNFTMGKEVEAFEQEFANYHDKRYGIMVNSGSSANLIAVASLFYKKDNPLQQGDEAIVPAIAWGTTYHPLHQYNMKIRLIDVALETLNLDILQLNKALSPQTRLLVAVNILGNPSELHLLQKFANDHNLYLLEDNCESLGAELNGRKTGTFGDLSTFSFFYSHQISTGEGGMILTDNYELADLARSLRAHGWHRDTKPKSVSGLYHFVLPGYNVRPLELVAAIGREQLKKLPNMTKTRRANLSLFRSLFKNDKRLIIPIEGYGLSSSFGFPIIAPPSMGVTRKGIFFALAAEEIEYRMITGGNILRHYVSKYYKISAVNNLPHANFIHNHGFFVGNYPTNLTLQITRLREVLDQIYKF